MSIAINPTAGESRVAALLAEVSSLSQRLTEATTELRFLLGESQSERFSRYRSPEFSKQLSEHLHAAKRAALSEACPTNASA